MNPILWKPTQSEQILPYHAFKEYVIRAENLDLQISDLDFHQWTVEHNDKFWSYVWQIGGIIGDKQEQVHTKAEQLIDDSWFNGSRLNFAENLLRFTGSTTAIYGMNEAGQQTEISWDMLRLYVSNVRHYLRDKGITKGDVVVGYLPNIWETVVCMLATTAEGAIWSSASPDFGVDAVVDRFGQLSPKLFITVDGYYYNKKAIAIGEKVNQILNAIAEVDSLTIPYLNSDNSSEWQSIIQSKQDVITEFTRLEFNHPLYIMFSSGTTGKPKCIVHGAGGTLIQHIKEHQLHLAAMPQDKLFYYTTCGWMMWNWMVSALASGVSIVTYDGSPLAQGVTAIFEMIDRIGITHFGTSPAYLTALEKRGVDRLQLPELQSLRVILSTGAPLTDVQYDYVYEKLRLNVCLASISGGTDIISCFVLGGYHLPVYRGEIQMAGLGMDVAVLDEQGNEIKDKKGELVCRNSFPSMPINFWNDLNKDLYRKSYFAGFKNMWTHGDYAISHSRGTFQILGRSDSTLNINGIRIGTAEIYRQLDVLESLADAVVVTRYKAGGEQMILFVQMGEGYTFNAEVEQQIRTRLRENMSPRHVPSKVIAVQDIPKTMSGKKMEKAVQTLINGDKIANIGACSNPESLVFFETLTI